VRSVICSNSQPTVGAPAILSLDLTSDTKPLDLEVTLLDRLSHGAVVLDLSRVDVLDSSFLRALLRCGRFAGLIGSDLAISNPTPPVRLLLTVSGVDRALRLLDAA
jgi:anti-anti-sigma regulatory factor